MKPTPIICAATSSEIPNRLHANGINNNEPPATPEAPQAHKLATRLSRIALPKETSIPKVCTAASVKIVMVIAAPAILMVAPNGIETEYVSSSKFRRLARLIFTGIFAAELRVKNAVTPLSRKQVQTSGYGLRRIFQKTKTGFTTKATNNMEPTNTLSN